MFEPLVGNKKQLVLQEDTSVAFQYTFPKIPILTIDICKAEAHEDWFNNT